MIRWSAPSRWLPLAAVAAACLALGQPPVVDEESYLDIAGQILEHPLRPYDWWRPWQPWGADRAGDAYLYAHPPLHLWWVALWMEIVDWAGSDASRLAALRAGATLPWAALLGWAVGALAEATCRRPSLAAAVWLGSPLVILGLHAGLMIDLGVVALASAAVAVWVIRGPGVIAGVLLGLACGWKYPALVLAPVFAWDAFRRGLRPWGALAGFGAVWGALEGWLWWVYGRPHLPYVLATAGEIGRGPLSGRGFGVVVRLGLLAAPLLWLARPRAAAAGLVLAAPVAWRLGDGGFAIAQIAILAGAGAAGGWILATGRRDRTERLLALWGGAAIAAVVFAHNYAGGRYLLPAALPLALLLTRALERRRDLRPAWVLAASWAGLGLAMSWSQARQARAAIDVAEQVIAAHPTGRFTGEWTFRWRMRAAGWTFWSPGEPLDGSILAAPVHSGPGPVPGDLPISQEIAASDALPLRLVDLEAGVGYHAETLGAAPIGWVAGPLERVTVYGSSRD